MGIGHLFLEVLDYILKVDLDVYPDALADIGIALGPCPGRTPAETEKILEDAAETAGEQVAEVPVCSSSEALRPVYARKAVVVVVLPLGLVGEYFVSLCGFLEPFLRSLVAGIAVRVVLDSQLAVSLLDLFLSCGLGNSKHFVVVAFVSHDTINLLVLTKDKLTKKTILVHTEGNRFCDSLPFCFE